MYDYDVIIVGGGLAGLTAAIHLSLEKHRVLVLEKKPYPHHKVCGEYVSNEIIPYLNTLGVALNAADAVQIDHLLLSTVGGKSVKSKLPLGGIGISRYHFDNLLYQKALSLGADFVFEAVTNIDFIDDSFEITTDSNNTFSSVITIGSYGKRSPLDKSLRRDFMKQKSGWLAIKGHYEIDEFPINEVALHNFNGGYGGLSKTENGAVNFCYLASYASFQKVKNITNFTEQVVAKNPYLKDFLEKATPVFAEPLSIAQISFDEKKSVENHIIMCGDTAGLIHPLCGNGMAMAIHSAKIASEHIDRYLKGKSSSREMMEVAYEKEWHKTFKKRLWIGRKLQSLLLNEKISNLALKVVTLSPTLLRKLIQQTHGKPIKC